MITMNCACGEKYYSDEIHRGKRILCRKCNTELTIGEVASSNAIKATMNHDSDTTNIIESHETASPTAAPSLFGRKAAIISVAIAAGAFIVIALVIITVSYWQEGRENGNGQSFWEKAQNTKNTAERNVSNETRVNKSPEYKSPNIPENPKRLALGASPMGKGIRNGLCKVVIINGNDHDAFVKVIKINGYSQLIRNFYIPKGDKYTATSIPPGSYIIKVGFGVDWNPDSKRFNYRSSFLRSEAFELEQTYTVESVNYTIFTATLYKVPEGDFRTEPISEEEFEK